VTRDTLPAWSLFAGLIAAAGLPIYIHAPKAYADLHGVGLGALGAVLFGLRLFDFVQDPALGWLAERARAWRGASVALAAALMAAGMVGLFLPVPPIAPLAWFALTLAVVFTAFSYLTIVFYAQGVAKAGRLGPGGHLRLATWREAGALGGICLAAVAPAALGIVTTAPFAVFAGIFAALALLAVLAMRREWEGAVGVAMPPTPFRAILADRPARRLLMLALVNAAPVAVTSTLFLYYVESRLAAPGWEGPLLLLFFLAAAVSVPLWGRGAARFGVRPMLAGGMILAILSFGWAAMLGAGDLGAFAVICALSGAALGADMTLMPAIFARRLAVIAPGAGAAFGLWSFVSKFTLAFAAVALLPLLESQGFRPGLENPQSALDMLALLYALLPCALKVMAVAVLMATPIEDEATA